METSMDVRGIGPEHDRNKLLPFAPALLSLLSQKAPEHGPRISLGDAKQTAHFRQRKRRLTMEGEPNGNPSSDTGNTVDTGPDTEPYPVIDIFDDDTPLACGIEDPELCESCQ